MRKHLILMAVIGLALASCSQKSSDILNPPQIPCDTITRSIPYTNLTKDTVYPGENLTFISVDGRHYVSRENFTYPFVYIPTTGSSYFKYRYNLGKYPNHDNTTEWGYLKTITNTTFNFGIANFTDIRDSIMTDTFVYNLYTMQNISIGDNTSNGWYVWIKNYTEY